VDLRGIDPDYYFFACLPLKIAGCDGAPARAVLIHDTSGAFLAAWESSARSCRSRQYP
jgi:hypothetical protein